MEIEKISNSSCHNGQLNGIRSIRKFLRVSNNATTETNNGVYINLIARYFWYQNENNNICCHIEIGWEPWYINNGVPNKWTSQGANNFSQSNCSTLKINGNIITYSSPIAAPIGNGSNMIYYDNGNIKPVEITNNYQSLYCFHITTASTDKNINIEYKYEYESSGTIYSVDFTDNNSLKIYRPSKYDDNFVFNRKGLNELIKNIKEYPLIGVTSTTMDSGAPGILFTHGNRTTTKIAVGNDISFNGANSISNPNTTTQNFGTFRVSVNGDNNTYEVPIKGFSTSNSKIIIGDNNTPITITGSTGSSINISGEISATTIKEGSSAISTIYQKKPTVIYTRLDKTNWGTSMNNVTYSNGVVYTTTGYKTDSSMNSNTVLTPYYNTQTEVSILDDIKDIIVSPVPNDGGTDLNDNSWTIWRNYGIRCATYTTGENSNIIFYADEVPDNWSKAQILLIPN